jgi:DNA repair protein RadA
LKARSGDKTAKTLETAEESVKRVSLFPFHGTGSPAIDELIGGGYRGGTLTELFGRSNSGKSQLAMQAALVAARDGMKSLYIDTEGAFRPERVEEIAKARGWESAGVLERIVYARSDSSSEQMEAVRKMGSRPATSACRLVIVDTLTRNFSLDLPGRSNLSSRQGALDIHLSEMARDAYLNGRAYVLTNRVTFGAGRDVAIGGRTVAQLVGASLLLERAQDRIKATVISSGKSALASVGPFGVD